MVVEHILGVAGASFRSCEWCDFGCDRCSEEDDEMGALVRGNQATRISGTLPPTLDVPVVRVLLECYEDGNGTLDGAWKCVPKPLLLALRDFLTGVKAEQEARWKRYEDAATAQGLPTRGLLDAVILPDGRVIEVPRDELELVDDFLHAIDDQLFYTKRWGADGKELPEDQWERVDISRVIDGGKLCL